MKALFEKDQEMHGIGRSWQNINTVPRQMCDNSIQCMPECMIFKLGLKIALKYIK